MSNEKNNIEVELEEKCEKLQNELDIKEGIINRLKDDNFKLKARLNLLEAMLRGVIDNG